MWRCEFTGGGDVAARISLSLALFAVVVAASSSCQQPSAPPTASISLDDGHGTPSLSLLQVAATVARSSRSQAAAKMIAPLPWGSLANLTRGGNIAPRWRSRAVSEDETVTVNHLAKCGGTLVRWALQHILPAERLRERSEVDELTRADVQSGTFIIGLVRNPYDYYVSLWAYTAARDDGHRFRQALDPSLQRRLYPKRRPRNLYGELPSDVLAFQQWLRAVSAEDVGLLTMRFYGHYLDQGRSARLSGDVWNTDTAANVLRGQLDLRVQISQSLTNFNASSGQVSCWVRTENVESDARACLTQYEEKIGRGVVDWARFNSLVPFAAWNKSPHKPCENFYDNETRALVARLDAGIVHAFGYPAHCHRAAEPVPTLPRRPARSAAVRSLAPRPVLPIPTALFIVTLCSWAVGS